MIFIRNLKTLSLKCGIDTIEIKTEVRKDSLIDGITALTTAVSKYYRYKINVDKLKKSLGIAGENCYSTVQKILEYIVEFFSEAEILNVTRIDVRYDNHTDDYGDYFKINSFLLAIIAEQNKIRDSYESREISPSDIITIRIQKKYKFEVEYYNKVTEREHKGKENFENIKARLEFRRKQIEYSLKDVDNIRPLIQDTMEWINSFLTESLQEFETKQVTCFNNNLLQANFSKSKRTITSFIVDNQRYVYTDKQLLNLIKGLNSKSPRKLKRKILENYEFETITENELEYYGQLLNSFSAEFLST